MMKQQNVAKSRSGSGSMPMTPAWLRVGEEGKREVTLTRGPGMSAKGKTRGRVRCCSVGFGPRFGPLLAARGGGGTMPRAWASWAKLLLLRWARVLTSFHFIFSKAFSIIVFLNHFEF